MRTNLIIVFTCPDRPGIVEQLTREVIRCGGNWEESRSARLCGDFAGIARVSVSTDQSDELSHRLSKLNIEGLTLHVKPAGNEPAVRGTTASLHCTGADHEGIVHALASCLASLGANVEEMETFVEPAPSTGTPVFSMTCSICFPEELDRGLVLERLRELAAELAVDVSLDNQPI